MSGHSKWHSIKHKKAAVDAKRGAIFTRLIREVTVAARNGGGDPSFNPRLRTAVAACKAANMPNKNIENGIKKGTGELEGVCYDEITYEGYGPGGVAILVETTTDNKNRTGAEVRHAFSKHNGKLGEPGSVNYMFDKRGQLFITAETVDEEEFMMAALDAGAEDVQKEDDVFTVITEQNICFDVKEKLEEAGYNVQDAQVTMIPQNTVKVEGKDAQNLVKLLGVLEDIEDTQNVSANFEMDDEMLEQLSS